MLMITLKIVYPKNNKLQSDPSHKLHPADFPSPEHLTSECPPIKASHLLQIKLNQMLEGEPPRLDGRALNLEHVADRLQERVQKALTVVERIAETDQLLEVGQPVLDGLPRLQAAQPPQRLV